MPPERIRIVFNMVEPRMEVEDAFPMLLAFLQQHPMAQADVRCRLGMNELYERIKASGTAVSDLAQDTTDYKLQIAQARSMPEKLALADQLANARLAVGVLKELDACFAALGLETLTAQSSGLADVYRHPGPATNARKSPKAAA